jgi:hypothetical protein
MASISSMKMMAGAFSFASRNTSRTIRGPCTCHQKWVLSAWINLFLEPYLLQKTWLTDSKDIC